MGTFYANNIVGIKSSLYEYIQSQGGAITSSNLLQINSISETLLVGSYPLPLCGIQNIMGTFVTGYEKRDHLGFFIKIEVLACMNSFVYAAQW